MTIHRDGEWLTSSRTEHVGCEIAEGAIRLSLTPDRLMTRAQAVAGLCIAEIVDQWGPLLWEPESPNVAMVWGLIRMHAETAGLDALDAVIRVQQSHWPMTAAERAEWTR
ncbi:hypothetical protein ACFVMC_32790 [Nocardia sp. NPDC127579]|uniref:hypothetical protein n=1 Tax=Nocardia sp. NPDC127579 TaxID=3345402 RepID=UPI0036261813